MKVTSRQQEQAASRLESDLTSPTHFAKEMQQLDVSQIPKELRGMAVFDHLMRIQAIHLKNRYVAKTITSALLQQARSGH